MSRNRSPRVRRFWHLLLEMKALVHDDGFSERPASEKLARQHWRDICASEYACAQWFRDNLRKFRDDLVPLTRTERLLERLRKSRHWREEQMEQDRQHRKEAAASWARYREEHREALEREARAREVLPAREEDPERVMRKLSEDH